MDGEWRPPIVRLINLYIFSSSIFCGLIVFQVSFSIFYKIIPYYFFNLLLLGHDRPWILVFFFRARITCFLTQGSTYFVLPVPMRKCLGKHSCRSSFPIASHTKSYLLFSTRTYNCTLRILCVIVEIQTH